MQDFQWTDHSLCFHFKTSMNIFAISFLLLQLQDVLGRISEEKCKEYAGLIREKQLSTDDLISAFTSIHLPGKLPTTPGEFPHMVHLGYGNGDTKIWACGGALISDEYILTVAQCQNLEVLRYSRQRTRRVFIEELLTKPFPKVPPLNSKVEWIRLGDKTEGLQEIKVKEIIVHPESKPGTMYNDIALLKLDQKVNFGKYMRPACLCTGEDNLVNETGLATGWGALRLGEYFSDDLMKVEMEIYSEEECKMEFNYLLEEDKGIIETQMCIGGHADKKALCSGDVGGPFQMKNQNYSNMYDIVGIVSFGNECNFPSFPVVTTRVSSFVPWIESIVWSTEN